MFERPDPSFEPSSQTKQALLYVRTRPMDLAGIRHPGYLGLHGYTVDRAMFMTVLVLELIALGMTYAALRQWNWVASAGIAFALIAVDITIAFVHQSYATGATKTLAMEAVIAKARGGKEGAIKLHECQEGMTRRRRIASLFALVLVGLALLKFLLYFMASRSDIADAEAARDRYALLIALAVAYGLTAILHIKATGYFVRGWMAQLLYQRDVREFFRSKGRQNSARTQVIELAPHPDFMRGLSVHTHAIAERAALDGSTRVHQLVASGLLLDSEIDEFINRMEKEDARSELVLKAMQLQVRMVAEE